MWAIRMQPAAVNLPHEVATKNGNQAKILKADQNLFGSEPQVLASLVGVIITQVMIGVKKISHH